MNNSKIKTNPKDDNSAQITAIQGVVQIQKVNTTGWAQASQGTKLYSQDKIRTLIDSLATLQYPDNTQLTLRENSILTIQDTSKDSKTGLSKRELKLDVGGMKYKVTRLTEKGSEFKIHTSTAIVGVTGTEGNIENGGAGKPTKNTLTEGTTYNTDESGKNGRPLNSGNSWEIDDKARSEKHMATPEETNNNTYKVRDPAVEQRFNDFMKKFNQKKDQGYDMTPLAKLFEQILETVSKNDSPRLNPLLDEAEKLFGTLKKFSEPKAQEINALIQSILQDIETKKKEGYDLSQVYSLLAQAQTAYQEEKYSQAEELLEQVKHALTTTEKKADDFKTRLTAFEDELNNKAKDGFIVNELIEVTKQIKIYFDSGAPAQAEELLNKAKEMLAAAKRRIPAESLKNLEDIKAEIADKKKDGFDVTELKELILLADKAVEENEYLKLEELLTQIREKLRLELTKPIPEDILRLFNTFEETLKKKQAAGFDLIPLQNLIKSAYDAKEKADFAALRTALTQAQDALLKLAPPEQLLKHFQELKDESKKKQDAGYEIKEIEGLITQAQTMLDKGAISDIADLFLQIETALNTLKDTQPPLLQAGDLIWADGDKNVTVSGIAKDNIKIAWVSINGGIVNLDANGNFQQNLILTPLLKEIIVESQDTSGNLAPEIRIPIAQDKLDSLTKIEDTAPPELKTENIRLTYIIPDELKIEGKSEANALITINGRDVLTDNQGVFSAQIKADKELVDKGLSIIGRDAGGNSSPELKIPVPDKWPPVIHAVQTELSDQIPPSLKVNKLVYEK
ncbi:MAG: FecR domain-containing protein [Candidatus Omnitrophota bacterium]